MYGETLETEQLRGGSFVDVKVRIPHPTTYHFLDRSLRSRVLA